MKYPPYLAFWIFIQGAVINPSEEDSQTFVVSAMNGEIYRLRGRFLFEFSLLKSKHQRIESFFPNFSHYQTYMINNNNKCWFKQDNILHKCVVAVSCNSII